MDQLLYRVIITMALTNTCFIEEVDKTPAGRITAVVFCIKLWVKDVLSVIGLPEGSPIFARLNFLSLFTVMI